MAYDLETVAINITKRRMSAGLSMNQLAKLAGVSTSTISYAEQGKTRLRSDKLSAIAMALGCTTTDLLTGNATVVNESIKWMQLWRQLSTDERKRIMEYAQWRYSVQGDEPSGDHDHIADDSTST